MPIPIDPPQPEVFLAYIGAALYIIAALVFWAWPEVVTPRPAPEEPPEDDAAGE